MAKTMRKRRKRRRKRRKTIKKSAANEAGRVFTDKEYNDNNGILTSIWGPPLWHFLTCMSFNYPVHPSAKQKRQYKQFILSLRHVLPCIYCRKNFKKNLVTIPLRQKDLENRNHFSRWMFRLHEQINKMLNKKSGLTYNQVRDRYEHFRARCNNKKKTRKRKEKGCVDSQYGKKRKCVLRILPYDKKCKTFQMNN